MTVASCSSASHTEAGICSLCGSERPVFQVGLLLTLTSKQLCAAVLVLTPPCSGGLQRENCKEARDTCHTRGEGRRRPALAQVSLGWDRRAPAVAAPRCWPGSCSRASQTLGRGQPNCHILSELSFFYTKNLHFTTTPSPGSGTLWTAGRARGQT